MRKTIIFMIILMTILLYGCAEQKADNIPQNASYLACGCGCCGGETPVQKCLYHSKGDDINNIVVEDQRTASSEQCAYVGCSLGIRYTYCD